MSRRTPLAEPSPEQRARGIRVMFSEIAGAYDLMNRVMSARLDVAWRRKAITMLADRPRERLLDLCGGTGDFGLEALRQGKTHGVVLADFAEPMVRLAARKHPPGPDWQLLVGDGLRLPFPDASFDAVICAFGVRNLVDHDAAAHELHRILRPGGESLTLELMGGQAGLGYRVFRAYFHHVLPKMGRMISGHPMAYTYLPNSVDHFLSPQDWAQRLERNGFEPPVQRDCLFGIATITLAAKPNALHSS